MSEQFDVSFILASKSLRRKLLLSEAGYKFEVWPSGVDESEFSVEGVSSGEYAKQLALAKAKDVAGRFPDSIVIGADTIVDFAGEVIGKPVDAEDARRITEKLFSGPHEVITGLAIVRLRDGVELCESQTTKVFPRKLSSRQIADHIKSQSWKGRAGAYGIKESGEEFVEKIEGSFTNVVGMPMELLERMLKKIVD